jgi:hypothetical protein
LLLALPVDRSHSLEKRRHRIAYVALLLALPFARSHALEKRSRSIAYFFAYSQSTTPRDRESERSRLFPLTLAVGKGLGRRALSVALFQVTLSLSTKKLLCQSACCRHWREEAALSATLSLSLESCWLLYRLLSSGERSCSVGRFAVFSPDLSTLCCLINFLSRDDDALFLALLVALSIASSLFL